MTWASQKVTWNTFLGSGNLKDKEREIREKLVMKLKRKAESGVASQEGRVSKVRLLSRDALCPTTRRMLIKHPR